VNRHHRKKPKFKILLTVPRGSFYQINSRNDILTFIRFSKCCCPDNQHYSHQDIRERSPVNCHCALD
jgi:hypothetical protein